MNETLRHGTFSCQLLEEFVICAIQSSDIPWRPGLAKEFEEDLTPVITTLLGTFNIKCDDLDIEKLVLGIRDGRIPAVKTSRTTISVAKPSNPCNDRMVHDLSFGSKSVCQALKTNLVCTFQRMGFKDMNRSHLRKVQLTMKEKLAAFGMKCDFDIANVLDEVGRTRTTTSHPQLINRHKDIKMSLTTMASTAASLTSTLKIIYSNMQTQPISKKVGMSVPIKHNSNKRIPQTRPRRVFKRPRQRTVKVRPQTTATSTQTTATSTTSTLTMTYSKVQSTDTIAPEVKEITVPVQHSSNQTIPKLYPKKVTSESTTEDFKENTIGNEKIPTSPTIASVNFEVKTESEYSNNGQTSISSAVSFTLIILHTIIGVLII